jgi:hypothetical protein
MSEWPSILWGIDDVCPAPIALTRGTFQECSEWGRQLPSPWRYEVGYENGAPNGLINELFRRRDYYMSDFMRPDLGDRYAPDVRSDTRYACRDCGDTSITDRVVHDQWHGDGLRVNAATRAILAYRSVRMGEICATLFGEIDESN